jgi:E3 ubiquitin-protein ligase NEDD4
MPEATNNPIDITVHVFKAMGLKKRNWLSYPDPFLVATVDQTQTQTSSVAKRTLDPFWNTVFTFRGIKPSSLVRLIVYDQKRFLKEHQGFLGELEFRVEDLMKCNMQQTFHLQPDNIIAKGEVIKGTITLTVNPLYQNNIKALSINSPNGSLPLNNFMSVSSQMNSSASSSIAAGTNTDSVNVIIRNREGFQPSTSTLQMQMYEELPFGWERRITTNGQFYYVDHLNKTTSWTHPGKFRYINNATELAEYKRRREEELGSLPPGWEVRATESGRIYYVDHNAQTTTWDDPRLPTSIELTLPKYRRDFQLKLSYFRSQHEMRTKSGRTQIEVTRGNLIGDAYFEFGKLTDDDLKRKLEIKFKGEEGVDYGGITREFFLLLSRELFDPNYCLFEYSSHNNYTLQPSRRSTIEPDHLKHFEFAGRVVGAAVFHRKFIDAFFVTSFYKQIRGMEITFEDLDSIDSQLQKNLQYILDNQIGEGEEEYMSLTMSVAEEEFGVTKVFDLIPGGRDTKVNDSNKQEYIDKYVQWRIIKRVESQMQAFLDGLFRIIPRRIINIFDDRELELLFGGITEIDIDDWKRYTEYKNCKVDDKVVKWFWKCVTEEFSEEQRTRLLQFITGSSRVPVNGFKDLQGNDGPRKFTIELLTKIHPTKQSHRNHFNTSLDEYLPKSHTCFNRIDLPAYSSYQILVQKLSMAIEVTWGFSNE